MLVEKSVKLYYTILVVYFRHIRHTCVSKVVQVYSIILAVCCRYIHHTCVNRGVQLYSIINPRRPCAARVTVVVLCDGLCVCVCVYDYSRTTGYEAAYERYQQLQCYKGKKKNVPILLRSRDMA